MCYHQMSLQDTICVSGLCTNVLFSTHTSVFDDQSADVDVDHSRLVSASD